MASKLWLCLGLGLVAVGCTPNYSPPEASNLVAVRPYPGADDICQVIGENDLTSEYLDHTQILVGCPAHETGAIKDRLGEGGTRLTQVGDWVLISVPDPAAEG